MHSEDSDIWHFNNFRVESMSRLEMGNVQFRLERFDPFWPSYALGQLSLFLTRTLAIRKGNQRTPPF